MGFEDSGFYEDSPSNSREILQRQHNQTRDYINSVVDRLNSKKEGESGSESIASPNIDGVSGDNVFSQIKDIKRQLSDATAGTISDGSITSEKIASKAVDGSKISENAIESRHFRADATAPFAADANKLNGIDGKMFEPHLTTGNINVFKDRVCDSKIYTLNGKTHKDFRYINNGSGKILKLSLTDGSLSEYLDVSLYGTDFRFDFDENDDLYIVFPKVRNSSRFGDFYKYSGGELYSVSAVKLSSDTTYVDSISDITIHNGILYIAFVVSGTYTSAYIYKISLSELKNTSEASPFFLKKIETYHSYWPLFFKDNDLYFYNCRLINADENNFTKYAFAFIGYDDKRFLVSHKNYYLLEENFLPCGVKTSTDSFSKFSNFGFIYKNYLYCLIDEYVFRSRLY